LELLSQKSGHRDRGALEPRKVPSSYGYQAWRPVNGWQLTIDGYTSVFLDEQNRWDQRSVDDLCVLLDRHGGLYWNRIANRCAWKSVGQWRARRCRVTRAALDAWAGGEKLAARELLAQTSRAVTD